MTEKSNSNGFYLFEAIKLFLCIKQIFSFFSIFFINLEGFKLKIINKIDVTFHLSLLL